MGPAKSPLQALHASVKLHHSVTLSLNSLDLVLASPSRPAVTPSAGHLCSCLRIGRRRRASISLPRLSQSRLLRRHRLLLSGVEGFFFSVTDTLFWSLSR
ncbi:hypothetical protein PIB30_032760 [Stylosanthes scabra]|uniref:Uncharacterized protein n=1 Tax=Stylosanthes scabra TaxID=79078 RepID=A0ABU6UBN4_9FABA|nr:hypothetical protein [Stylosanthes scabra]